MTGRKSRETTILVDVSDKRRLDERKIHEREPYREVLKRVLDELETNVTGKGVEGKEQVSTRDQLIETTINQLGQISKGRLADWNFHHRSHEKLLLDQAKGD